MRERERERGIIERERERKREKRFGKTASFEKKTSREKLISFEVDFSKEKFFHLMGKMIGEKNFSSLKKFN